MLSGADPHLDREGVFIVDGSRTGGVHAITFPVDGLHPCLDGKGEGNMTFFPSVELGIA